MAILTSCGGGGGGGGGGGTGGSVASAAGGPAPVPSPTLTQTPTPTPSPTPQTGFVDAQSIDSATRLQINAPIAITQPGGGTKTGTGRVFSDNLPVGQTVTVTFGDFAAGGYASPQNDIVTQTITVGSTSVTGAYDALPPPPP